jgi:ethanolamine phosphate transferase 2 subunit G
MSSAASNYDVTRLMIGSALAATSVLLAGIAALAGMTLLNADGVFAFVMATLYGIMMFASSYVEEEQHFWYWIAGGWVAYLGCLKYVSTPSIFTSVC